MLARFKRLALRVVVVLAVIVLVAGAVGYLVARSCLPSVEGRATLPGLSAEVSVRRDHLGVPHITAASEADAWAAVGFVHGQDRFFQMDLARRAVSGRLSELFGKLALDSDRQMRQIRLATTVQEQMTALPDEDRRMLDAYARGVNAGLTATGRPVECMLLAYTPEPWTAVDSLYVVRFMEEMLTVDGGESVRARLATALGASVAGFLYDFEGMVGPTILGDSPLPATTRVAPVDADPPPAPSTTPPTDGAAEETGTDGSNAWAIAGSRTVSGLPLLANDTHLAAAAPAIFYQAHIRFPGVDVVGMTVPGTGFPVLGHNGHVAWGVTVLMADQLDEVRLDRDPDDPSRYRVGAGWATLGSATETIRVRGGDDAEVVVRTSVYGPVLVADDGSWVARQWTADRIGRTAIAVRAFHRCTTVAELLAATDDFTGPGMSFVAADRDGHIGYRAAAAMPERGADDGRLPRTSGQVAPWPDLVAADRSPRALDPERGYIVSANHRIGNGSEAMRVGSHWAEPWRAESIIESIEAAPRHDVASVAAMQLDVRSARARAMLAVLPEQLVDGDADVWWQRLRRWDGSFAIGVEPALFEAFDRALRKAVFEDETGDHWSSADRGLLKVIEARGFDALDPELQSRDWIDDTRSEAHETRDEIVARAVVDAVAQLRESFGDDEDDWVWERVHTLAPPHPMTAIPVVGRLFAIAPRAIPGSWHTVNATAGSLRRRFRVGHIPVFRMVIDLADVRRSMIVSSTGQSGHFMSEHYDDQFDDFVAGRLHPMVYAEDDVASATVATLTLHP